MRVELETETGIGSPIRGNQKRAEPIERPDGTPSRPGGTRSSAPRPPKSYSCCVPCSPIPARAHGHRLRTPDEARMTPFPARATRRAFVPGAAFLWLFALPARGQAPAAVAADLAASRERLAALGYVTPAPEIVKLVSA